MTETSKEKSYLQKNFNLSFDYEEKHFLEWLGEARCPQKEEKDWGFKNISRKACTKQKWQLGASRDADK